jgi:hypothetical protein
MKSIYSLIIMSLCAAVAATAQPLVQQTNIALTSINLRTAQAVVVGRSVFASHPAGTAVVRFDGTLYADSGDRITIAASNTPDWGLNDGNVSVKVADPSTQCRSFSHTRVYNVMAGTDTFYAVAQNYVDQLGTGVGSIYGHLTVEFFQSAAPAVGTSNINWSGDLSSGQKRADSVVANSAPIGKAFVHMDGQVYSDPGDRIVLTANYAPSWLVDAGSVAFMAVSNTNKYSPFTHSRVFDITGNPNTFYAMGTNVVDQGGSGYAYVYGNISAEFFPTGSGTSVDNIDVVRQGLNVRGGAVALDSLSVNAPFAGKMLVQFDGYITSTVGDNIVLAASPTRHWNINEGCVNVAALSHANPFNVFSHSVLVSVGPGNHKFYAVAENYVYTAGAGTMDIAANFSVKYFPDAGVGVNDVAADKNFSIYPNPAQNNMIVLFPKLLDEMQTIEISDMTGRNLVTTEAHGVDQVQINLSSLPVGMYLVRCNGVVRKLVKE